MCDWRRSQGLFMIRQGLYRKGLTCFNSKTKLFRYWCDGYENFKSINPAQDCRHHCVANQKNIMLHDYFNVDPPHVAFD